MRLPSLAALAFVVPSVLAFAAPSHAQATLPHGFSDELIVGGLNYSCSMALLPDDRLLVIEKYDARVRLVADGMLVPLSVAVIDSVRFTSESGLLGIAVDPKWPSRPYVYLHYNYLGSRNIRIARYTAVGDLDGRSGGPLTLDLSSRHLVIADLRDESTLHNAGSMRFGPDGMLYLSLGDDQNLCDAVKLDRLVGKVLRLDVSRLPDGPGGPPDYGTITPADNPFVDHPSLAARLVWAYGLRNPYSFQIDEETGHLTIADVGEEHWEELDYQDQPGMNFGWPTYEGPVRFWFPCAEHDSVTAIPPIYAYDRDAFTQGAAIITSPTYRRGRQPLHPFPKSYEGDVFVNDVGEGILRRVKRTETGWRLANPVAGQPTPLDWGTGMVGVTDYLMHPSGALWYLKYAHYFESGSGQLRRIVYDGGGPLDAPGPESASGVGFSAYPSPAVARAAFGFRTARSGPARLSIFDASGREVRRLLEERELESGAHSRAWDLLDSSGRRVAPGVYLAVLESAGRRFARRLPVLR